MRFRLALAVPVASFLLLAAACAGKKSQDEPGAAPPSPPPPEELTWVERPDGTRSCKTQSPEKLESWVRSFQEAEIAVSASEHVHDGKMRAQLCGIRTGWHNRLQIRRGDLEKAVKLEFGEPGALEEAEAGEAKAIDSEPAPKPSASEFFTVLPPEPVRTPRPRVEDE